MLALLALTLVGPAVSPLLSANASTSLTYYLHGDSPVGNAQSTADFASTQDVRVPVVNQDLGTVSIDGVGATMDAAAPGGLSPKVAQATGLGNPDYRRNGLLMYWRGEVYGHVSDASATLYLSSPVPAEVTVTLFGDGSVGSGSPIARDVRTVTSTSPAPVVFDLSEAAANVRQELVLSVSSKLPSGSDPSAGVAIHYDGSQAASSLSFRLGDFVDPPPPLARTPVPGWGAVGIINTTASQRETSLAISPLDDDLLFACAPSGVPSIANGQSYFHVSRDGGASWSYLEVETGTTDPRRFAFEGGDCDVAFDAAGTMYSADTWLGSLSIGHSTDGGLTWSGTSLAASAPVVDRPWIVGGPAGVVHATWQDVQALMPSVIWYARSTDYGLTFTPAVPIARATPDGPFTWEGNFVVSPDQQDLYLVYTRRAGPVTDNLDGSGPESVWVAASHDGGATWSQHLVAQMENPASYLYPSIALDSGNKLHVVFSSRTGVDRPIWYVTSDDEARTWGAPIKVLANVAAWSPWVVGAGEGDAAIQWYGTLDPLGNTTSPNDWYFFTARVEDGVVVSAGPTTSTPIFVGTQSAIPEFNQLRVDSQGRIHIGASAYLDDPENGVSWALFHQREG